MLLIFKNLLSLWNSDLVLKVRTVQKGIFQDVLLLTSLSLLCHPCPHSRICHLVPFTLQGTNLISICFVLPVFDEQIRTFLFLLPSSSQSRTPQILSFIVLYCVRVPSSFMERIFAKDIVEINNHLHMHLRISGDRSSEWIPRSAVCLIKR